MKRSACGRAAVLLCLLGFFLAFDTGLAAAEGNRRRVKVFAPDTVQLLRTLERRGYDVLGRNGPAGFVEVIARPGALAALRKAGFRVEVSGAGSGSRGVPPGYHDYDAVKARLFQVEDQFPQIARVVDVSVEYGVGPSHEGRHLYALEISDHVDQDEDEPNVYLVFNHHAREVTTVEYGLWIIDELTQGYGTDPEVTKWVNTNQIYIAPTWNPDGLEYCFNTDPWWRKNRNPVGSGYYGVDLNRNYDFNWYGPYSGSTFPGSDTYKGPAPESEQETRCEVAFALDRHFAKVLDFHSYGSEVVYTYYLSPSSPLESWFDGKAEALGDALHYGGDHRKPSAEGEHYQWELSDVGAFSFLVETGWEFQPPFSTAHAEYTNHVRHGIRWFLDHEIPLQGHVKEAVSGAPLEADIAVNGITYTQGEVRSSEPRFGRYHYFLPPGNYQVTFSSPGYAARSFDVTVWAGKSTTLEVQLGPGPVLTVTGEAAMDGILDLDFDWPAGAGQVYMNGVSFTNTGFHFKNGVFVPIGWDYLYQITVGAFPGWMGTLDGNGHGDAVLPIPRDPVVLGLELYMAYFTMDPATSVPTAASAAVKIVIEG